MQGMCLCLVYHVCNTILTYCWLPSVFFRWFAHGLVKPIGNSTKWTQSAVKRKAFEHGAKSMVTESAIRVIEIARCLFSKQTKTAGPQWTTLPSFFSPLCCDPALSVFASKCQGECHAVKAALCDLGDPGWGDPWFPHWALLLFAPFKWPMVFLWLFRCCLVLWACVTWHISCHLHALRWY